MNMLSNIFTYQLWSLKSKLHYIQNTEQKSFVFRCRQKYTKLFISVVYVVINKNILYFSADIRTWYRRNPLLEQISFQKYHSMCTTKTQTFSSHVSHFRVFLNVTKNILFIVIFVKYESLPLCVIRNICFVISTAFTFQPFTVDEFEQ